MENTDVLQQIRDGHAALAQLAAGERGLRQQHVVAVHDRDEIPAAAEPIEIIIANMRRVIDEAATEYARDNGYTILTAFTGRLELQMDGTLATRRPQLWFGPRLELRFRDLCGLVPELIKAQLETILRSVPYQAGLPLEERAAAIAAADEKIRVIEEQHTELCDTAAALDPPIVLPLLEPVKQRREAARLKAERDAAARQVREEAARRVDVQPRNHPRAGYQESEYIAEGQRRAFD